MGNVSSGYFFTNTMVVPNRKARRPKNVKINDVGREIIRLFVKGSNGPAITNKLGASKQVVNYWKQLALERGILIEAGRNKWTHCLMYGAGPNYYFIKYRGWQNPNFLPLQMRVHFDRGNVIAIPTIAVDPQLLNVKDENGKWVTVPLFTKVSVKKRYYKRYSAVIRIDQRIIGYSNAEATVVYETNKVNLPDVLYISPPEIKVTADCLIGDNPQYLITVRRVIIEILSLFSMGDWVFKQNDVKPIFAFEWKDNLHFGIQIEYVEKIYPELKNHAHRLLNGENEEDFVLYIDHSHGKYELETTSVGIANDILSMMDVNLKKLQRKPRIRKP
jgi:hypothetical protein